MKSKNKAAEILRADHFAATLLHAGDSAFCGRRRFRMVWPPASGAEGYADAVERLIALDEEGKLRPTISLYCR
jgi:hypothetical protein